jgi:hypothetical protein
MSSGGCPDPPGPPPPLIYATGLKYNEYNETLIEIKDTLLQKLNIYSKRLKRYKNNKQRKFENKLFRNNEKLFYKNLADNKTQNNNGIPNIKLKNSGQTYGQMKFNLIIRQNGFLI